MPGAVTLTTIAVTPVLITLIVLDVADGGVRRWFDTHAFTSDVVTSILVLLITVLIVDRVLAARRQRDRALVIGAQAAIISRQARRTLDLVRESLTNPDRRETATDEMRTYMAMLLVSAPVLMEASTARAFLETAQRLAALMSHALEHDSARSIGPRLDAGAQAMRDAVTPLLAKLDDAQLRAVDSADDGDAEPATADGATEPGDADGATEPGDADGATERGDGSAQARAGT
jgi:hypothetical protein